MNNATNIGTEHCQDTLTLNLANLSQLVPGP